MRIDRKESFGKLELTVSAPDMAQVTLSIADGVEPYSRERLLRVRGLEGLPNSLLDPVFNEVRGWRSGPGFMGVEVSEGASLAGELAGRGFVDYILYLKCRIERAAATTGISVAGPDDIAEIRALAREAESDILADPGDIGMQGLLAAVQDRPPTFAGSCNLDDPTLVFLVSKDLLNRFQGYVVLDTSDIDVWINDIAVVPSRRGTRVARDLLMAARSFSQGQGFNEIYAQVATRNPRSWKCALRTGFEITGRDWMVPLQSVP